LKPGIGRPHDPLPRQPARPEPDSKPASAGARPGLGRSDRQRLGVRDPADPEALPHSLSDVPDVLAPGLRVVFCGINPGRVSAAARAHFANPRNDFWRLLHDAGFTPRTLDPAEQWELLRFGCGLTNAAYRTTKGSGDLRKGDFAGSLERLERIAVELRPRAIAFVGKEAYRGVFGVRPDLGRQPRLLEDTLLFVLPSTSPANAAVPYAERLRWFRALNDALPEPEPRPAVRALLLDERVRVLLIRYVGPDGGAWWALPGGAIAPGEADEEALRRELAEETGLAVTLGPCIWTREFVFPFGDLWYRQTERIHLTRTAGVELAPAFTPEQLVAEGVHEHRWWTLKEIEASGERFAPRRLGHLLRNILEQGPPPKPLDVGP
jgi:double-stranded uracil-DNA glycosylase